MFSFSPISDIRNLLAFHKLPPLPGERFLPWGPFSMQASGLLTVLNDLIHNQKTTLVECGGGISTLYLGNALRISGGHLTTIEESEQWCDLLSRQIRMASLEPHVTIVHAPLTVHEKAWDATWYDASVLQKHFSHPVIDFLLVDGPTAWQKERQHARYPALPFFRPFLKDSATIVLDDVDRPGERRIMDRWEREFAVTFEKRPRCERIAIGRFPGASPRTNHP